MAMIIPPGYKVRFANTYGDRWNLYKSLTLLREPEPQQMPIHLIVLWVFLFLVLIGIGFAGYMSSLTIMHVEPSILSLTIITFFSVLMTIAGSIMGCVLILYLIFLILVMWIRDSTKFAIASRRGKFVGAVQINIHQDYVTLAGLYVAPSHRRKGLGSYLVNYVLRRNDLPVYVFALPGSEAFYTRIGFVKHQEKRGYNMIYIEVK
jgi:GNAT superfamily N-acetyltransferase